MKNKKNLKVLTREISCKLVDSTSLLEVLENIADGEGKQDYLISLLKKNIKNAFFDIEYCRKLISNVD